MHQLQCREHKLQILTIAKINIFFLITKRIRSFFETFCIFHIIFSWASWNNWNKWARQSWKKCENDLLASLKYANFVVVITPIIKIDNHDAQEANHIHGPRHGLFGNAPSGACRCPTAVITPPACYWQCDCQGHDSHMERDKDPKRRHKPLSHPTFRKREQPDD